MGPKSVGQAATIGARSSNQGFLCVHQGIVGLLSLDGILDPAVPAKREFVHALDELQPP